MPREKKELWGGEPIMEKANHFVIDGKGDCWKATAKSNYLYIQLFGRNPWRFLNETWACYLHQKGAPNDYIFQFVTEK